MRPMSIWPFQENTSEAVFSGVVRAEQRRLCATPWSFSAEGRRARGMRSQPHTQEVRDPLTDGV